MVTFDQTPATKTNHRMPKRLAINFADKPCTWRQNLTLDRRCGQQISPFSSKFGRRAHLHQHFDKTLARRPVSDDTPDLCFGALMRLEKTTAHYVS